MQSKCLFKSLFSHDVIHFRSPRENGPFKRRLRIQLCSDCNLDQTAENSRPPPVRTVSLNILTDAFFSPPFPTFRCKGSSEIVLITSETISLIRVPSFLILHTPVSIQSLYIFTNLIEVEVRSFQCCQVSLSIQPHKAEVVCNTLFQFFRVSGQFSAVTADQVCTFRKVNKNWPE